MKKVLSASMDRLLASTRNGVLTRAGFAVAPAHSEAKVRQLLEWMGFDLLLIDHTFNAEVSAMLTESAKAKGVKVLLVYSGYPPAKIAASSTHNNMRTPDQMLETITALFGEDVQHRSIS